MRLEFGYRYYILWFKKENIHGKNDFAEKSKILAGYRSEK